MRRVVIAAALFVAIGAGPAGGQAARWRPVVRADVFAAAIDAAHAAVGATTDVGPYVRLDAVVGGGAAWRGDEAVPSARAEVVGRFVLDPFHQARWGPYVGAGLIARLDEGDEVHGWLSLAIGTELPGNRRWGTAIELGYGGGVRVGVALRARRPGRR